MYFTGKEKAFCVLEFDKNNLWTSVQRKFWTKLSSYILDEPSLAYELLIYMFFSSFFDFMSVNLLLF